MTGVGRRFERKSKNRVPSIFPEESLYSTYICIYNYIYIYIHTYYNYIVLYIYIYIYTYTHTNMYVVLLVIVLMTSGYVAAQLRAPSGPLIRSGATGQAPHRVQGLGLWV